MRARYGSKMSFPTTSKIIDSRLFTSLTQFIDVKIQDDRLPLDTVICVKSSKPAVTCDEPSVIVHTFPVTPFVVIQIL